MKRLIEAFLQVTLFDLHLVIVGKGMPSRTQKRILWLGKVSDRELILTSINMRNYLSFPSLYEGFGLPPLEAMACGCPVLLFLKGEHSRSMWRCSVYFDPFDVSGLARAIERVCGDRDLRQAIIFKRRERVLEFSWRKTAERYRAIFEELCREGKN